MGGVEVKTSEASTKNVPVHLQVLPDGHPATAPALEGGPQHRGGRDRPGPLGGGAAHPEGSPADVR